jgi:hypothetical protein
VTRAFRPDVYSSGGASCRGGPTLPSLVFFFIVIYITILLFVFYLFNIIYLTVLPLRVLLHIIYDFRVFYGFGLTHISTQGEKRRRHAPRPLWRSGSTCSILWFFFRRYPTATVLFGSQANFGYIRVLAFLLPRSEAAQGSDEGL